MKTSKPIGTLSILAAVALIQHRFVTTAGGVPASGAFCPGVANDHFDAGEAAGVDFAGVVLVESGAAIAADAAVQTDASGRAITLAAGVNLGRALDAATAAGELVRVKLD